MNLSQYRYLLPEYRLRLVVIVVGYKVFHCVMWEKGLEFASKLGCQGLIVSNDQGRPLYLLDHLGNGKSLASTRCPKGPALSIPSFTPLARASMAQADHRTVQRGFQLKVHERAPFHKNEARGTVPQLPYILRRLIHVKEGIQNQGHLPS